MRCTDCRKAQQGLERHRRRYEELIHRHDLTVEENLEMAECILTLMENGVFHRRQAERVRMLLNCMSENRDKPTRRRYDRVERRLLAVDAAGGDR